MNMPYTRREHLADATVHGVGVTTGVVGALWLLVTVFGRGGPLLLAAMGIYGFGLLAMLGFSAAYNLVADPARREQLRTYDHAAIFVMIAGTYTPLALVALKPGDGLGLFAFMWAAALGGGALKLVWPRRFERLSIAAYLVLGWTFLWMWKPLIAAIPPTGIWLLLAGGALYTAGVGFHLARRMSYHNALWHALVLAAAACHYAVILRYVAMPAVG
ncbi:MAG: hemolysin III family protein [Rhodospirillaceae bacterium]|nr:MAG: hemolysin III family protein [Rhodospirillaceae bacterium]